MVWNGMKLNGNGLVELAWRSALGVVAHSQKYRFVFSQYMTYSSCTERRAKNEERTRSIFNGAGGRRVKRAKELRIMLV